MSKNKEKFSLGVIFGLVIGAIAGLLTAPKSGKETRKDIKNKAKEARGTAERKLKEAHKDLSKVSDELKVKAKKLQGKAKDEADAAAKKADDLKDRVKSAITIIKSGDGSEDETNLDDVIKEAKSFTDTVKKRAQAAIERAKKQDK